MSNNGSERTDLDGRRCPHCNGDDIDFVQRGYAGLTDTPDQFFTCRTCGERTYEIVSRTGRELRMERIEPGRRFKLDGNEYLVSRILKVGLDEALVYLKPSQFPSLRR